MSNNANEFMNLSFQNLTRHTHYTYNFWSNMDAVPHRHEDFYEIGLITKGNYIQNYRGQTLPFSPGTIYLFNIGSQHSMNLLEEESTHFNICFQKDFFQSLVQQFAFSDVFFEKDLLYVKLPEYTFEYLLSICNALSAGQQESFNIRLFFFNALGLLSQESTYSNNSFEVVVDDILEKIRNHTYLFASIQEIYDHYPYSPPTIISRFKQRTGMTIIQFQTIVKMDWASRILRETEQPIDEIAANLGYVSTSRFFKLFKTHIGTTPAAYRQNYRDKDPGTK